MARRHEEARAAGLCRDLCGRPAREGRTKCQVCGAKDATGRPEDRLRLRREVLAAYGGQCACCGERTPEFLQVDHINNDGAAHRRSISRKSGEPFAKWLRRNGWPPGFQLLCANCNSAKGFYGACPHETARVG